MTGKGQQPQTGPALPAGRKRTLGKWGQVTWGVLCALRDQECARMGPR